MWPGLFGRHPGSEPPRLLLAACSRLGWSVGRKSVGGVYSRYIPFYMYDIFRAKLFSVNPSHNDLRVCFFFVNKANKPNQTNHLEKKYIVRILV